MNRFLHGSLTRDMSKWGGIVCLGVGLFGILAVVASDMEGPGARFIRRYIDHLDHQLRSMFIFTKPVTIVYGQLAALFVVLSLLFLVGAPGILAPVSVILIGALPSLRLAQMKVERRKNIELQIEQMLVGLANALKSTPSIGAAFTSVIEILPHPISQEVDLMVKEIKVGSTLDLALLNMAQRVGSSQLDSALSAVLIGRQVGGNLPRVLETTAATLREMNRLEGVVRTKIAEGKVQLYVIAMMPAVLIVGLNVFWPGYFDAFSHGFGPFLAFIAFGFWLAGILLARKIMAVNI